MKTRRIILGVALLALAGGIVGTRMGVIPNIPVSTIILGAISAVLVLDGLRHRNFFLILIPLAFIGHKLCDLFAIFPSLGLFETMGVAALTAAGLTVLFGNKKNREGIGSRGNQTYINDWDPNSGYHGTELDKNRFTQHPGFPDNGAENTSGSYGSPNDDGDNVVIDNGFGKLTRYLHSSNLKNVKISNGFGNCIVYYDNVYIDEDGSRLEISNGFGQVNVYIPPFYRFKMKQDNGFGSINIHGQSNLDPNAPLIEADINNGMGKVNIYFG